MSNVLLSSEQALDDYFTALLAEEYEVAVTQRTRVSQEVQAQLQTAPQAKSWVHPHLELEIPNLDDVQRLLSQLETSNPVADLQLEAVMEQNTCKIAQQHKQAAVAIDEIQEWEIESPQVLAVTELTQPEIKPKVEALEEPKQAKRNTVESTKETRNASSITQWQNPQRSEPFQVLYFDVNGVTFAVPLDHLGGIHRKEQEQLSHLIGRPSWYLGLQTNKDEQLDVVDTAKWAMPEKLRDDTYKEAYQYIVMLGDSRWGLACTQLAGTELLQNEKVRWREQMGKRPWLAGMVKEKMCALIHVEALIAMLNAGLDVKALDN